MCGWGGEGDGRVFSMGERLRDSKDLLYKRDGLNQGHRIAAVLANLIAQIFPLSPQLLATRS